MENLIDLLRFYDSLKKLFISGIDMSLIFKSEPWRIRTSDLLIKRKSVYMPKENAIPLQLMQLKENSIAESKGLINNDLCNVAIDAISFNDSANKNILEIIGEV